MNVFILATCRKPELLRMATLVFETIRVGFPTASINVFINQTDQTSELEIKSHYEDTDTGTIYWKQTGAGTNTGWI